MWAARTPAVRLGRRLSAVMLGLLAAWLVVTVVDIHGLARSDGTPAHVTHESPWGSQAPDQRHDPGQHAHYDDASTHVHPGPAAPVGAAGAGSSIAAASERQSLALAPPQGLVHVAGPHLDGAPHPFSPEQLQVLRN